MKSDFATGGLKYDQLISSLVFRRMYLPEVMGGSAASAEFTLGVYRRNAGDVLLNTNQKKLKDKHTQTAPYPLV